MKIKSILCRKNPFEKSKCHQKMCPLCFKSEFVEVNTEEVKVSCNTNNVGYRWICVNCEENDIVKVYEGETGRSARLRGAEHLKQLQQGSEDSALYKHRMAEHPNQTVKFKMEITGQFKDALTRQANEAIRISSRPGHQILNSKSEFNRPPIAKVLVERNKKFRT